MESSKTSLSKRIGNSLRHQGLRTTALKLKVLMADHLFDFRHGVDTCSPSELSDLTIAGNNRERGARYQPTRVVPLRKLFRAIRPMLPEQSVLVDFGCGKGRILLVASEFGFKEIRGIEFAHELCEIANKNKEVYKRRAGSGYDCRIIEEDVSNYAINPDENVFFMFNPFDETILKKVLFNIAASLRNHPRKVLIIYCNPENGRSIEQTGIFTKLQNFDFWSHQFTVYSNSDAPLPTP